MGVCGYNLLRVLLGVRWVKSQLQKILKWYTNRKKMKAVWFGFDLRFGLIDICLGISDWLAFGGVYSFKAEKGIGFISLCLNEKMGTRWIGSKRFSTNYYLFVGNLFDYFADFNSRVVENKTTKIFVDPLAVWTTCELFSNRWFYHTWVEFDREWLGWVFLLRDTLEMWSFPFKGRGDDADMDTTFVRVFLYSENVCISGVLAHDYLLGRDYIWCLICYECCLTYNYPCLGLLVRCIWLVAWNIVNLVPLRRVECCISVMVQGYMFVDALTRYDNGGVRVMLLIQASLELDPLTHSGHSRKVPSHVGQLETYYEWWIAWTQPVDCISSILVSGFPITAAHTIKDRDASCLEFSTIEFLTLKCAADLYMSAPQFCPNQLFCFATFHFP